MRMRYEEMGRRIKVQRKRARLTQEQLAEMAGISLSFYGHVERGSRKASLETLVRICNALQVSPEYILQDSLEKDLNGCADHFSEDERDLMNRIIEVIHAHNTKQ